MSGRGGATIDASIRFERHAKDMVQTLLQIPPEDLDDDMRKSALNTLKQLEDLDKKRLREKEAREIVQDVITRATRERNKQQMKQFSTPAMAEKFFQKTLASVTGPSVSPLQEEFDKVRKLFGAMEISRAEEKPLGNGDTGAVGEKEDDIQIEFKYVNKDPLTKQKIRNPVKNKICGHVYDKKSILEFIATNEKIRDEKIRKVRNTCPWGGCGNQNYLSATDIEDFPEFFDMVRDEAVSTSDSLNETQID